MARRGAVGGFYYLVGWLVVAIDGDAFDRHATETMGMGIGFFTLALARLALGRHVPDDADADAQSRYLVGWWGLVLATAALWSVFSTWCYIDVHFAHGHVASIMCSMAFVTSIAFVYPMRWRPALVCAALLVAPSLAWSYALPEQPGAAIVLTLYTIYLIGALFTNHADFRAQCAQRRELAEQRDRYADLALTDALTQLPNRRVFTGMLEQSFAADAQTSLLIVDIDHFKHINDEHGHAAGDACLVAFGELLCQAVAGWDALVARLGGEEFGIVLTGVAQPVAKRLALTIRRRLHEAAGDSALLGVTASIGVGARRAEYRRPEEWFVDVDRAMYRAKRCGRDCIRSVGS